MGLIEVRVKIRVGIMHDEGWVWLGYGVGVKVAISSLFQSQPHL